MNKVNSSNSSISNDFQQSPTLVPDCLDLILNNFEDDIGTLFSCLFVNHIWYNLAAQQLWKDPFLVTSSYQKAKLIHIYVASLPHKEIRQLNEKGLEIPYLVAPNFKLPYFSYLKTITYDKIEECALEWLINESSINSGHESPLSYLENVKDNDEDISDEEYEPLGSDSSEESSDDDKMSVDDDFEDILQDKDPMFILHQQELAFAIFKQLFVSCKKLDVLDMALFSQNSVIPNIIHIPGCHRALSDLTKFRFSQQGAYAYAGVVSLAKIVCFLSILGYSSRNIIEIEMAFDTEVDESHLSNLINIQENLQYLTIKYTQCRFESESFLDSIPQSLKFLELYNVKLSEGSFRILLGCKNLEEIKLIKCSDPHYMYQLNQSQLIESETLRLEEIYWKENISIHHRYFVSLIKASQSNLREFIFIPNINDQLKINDAHEVLNALAKFCPNITLLAIKNISVCYSRLVKLFKSHPWEKLTYLALGSDNNYVTPNIALQELAPHLPASLRKLRVACEVSADDLKAFFEGCKVPIEELHFPDMFYLHTDRHLEIVMNYTKEKRTLKYFDFIYSLNISPELWDKLKGILKTKGRQDPFYYPFCHICENID